jgi:anti-anti-sigma factor
MFELHEAACGPSRAEVRVCGEVDMATAPAMQEAIERAASSPPIAEVTVDLGGVTFMDSSGLAALVNAQRALSRADQIVSLGRVTPRIERVLEVSGLAAVLLRHPRVRALDEPA